MSDDKENIEQEKVNKKSWWKKVVGFKPNLRTTYSSNTIKDVEEFLKNCRLVRDSVED